MQKKLMVSIALILVTIFTSAALVHGDGCGCVVPPVITTGEPVE